MNIVILLIKRLKWELITIISIIGLLLLSPIFAVAIVTASGQQVASNVLATINPITHLVEIFDSRGNKTGEVTLTTTWPTTGYISDTFGTNGDFRQNLGLGAHSGIDIANERGLDGTPVTTFMEGVVSRVDTSDDSACGISVQVRHLYSISSLYCHLRETATQVNAAVRPGDVIGYMGNTGASTGVHLHFQVMISSIPVNPRTFMVGEPKGTYAGN